MHYFSEAVFITWLLYTKSETLDTFIQGWGASCSKNNEQLQLHSR